MENTQVIVTTHSPYFVSGKGVESIRLVRWDDERDYSTVSHVTLEKLSNCTNKSMDCHGSISAAMTACVYIFRPFEQSLT